MSGTKRPPAIPVPVRLLYAGISKAEWAELYVDLCRQVFGDTVPSSEIVRDIEQRLAILRSYRGAR